MENAISVNLTPVQLLLSLAFQAWLIIFPIILIRKLNSLNELLRRHLDDGKDAP